jgi:hypothetical protein
MTTQSVTLSTLWSAFNTDANSVATQLKATNLATGTPIQGQHPVYQAGGTVAWSGSWISFVANYKVTTKTTITSGQVFTMTQGANTVYRYVTTARDVSGYPTTDAIYTTFNGTDVPTNLLVQRSI